MSDGIVLRADITFPVGVKGPFPTALTITGYGKTSPASGIGGGSTSDLVKHGYATMVLDDRGTGNSGGTWDSWGTRTIADYGEVLDWIVKQPWSDGRIGMTGASYMGITSLLAASTGRPAVKAVFATVPMADGYRDIVEAGGEINTAFIPLWMGLVTGLGANPNGFAEAPQVLADHLPRHHPVPGCRPSPPPLTGGAPAYDGPFWRQRSPIEVAKKITAPTFIVGGLDDLFQRGEPLLYEHLADHTDARLLIGPWTHIAAGTGLPRDGVPDTGSLLLQWFDQHVLGLPAHAECIPPVTQYVRGHERYESATSWPVPGLTAGPVEPAGHRRAHHAGPRRPARPPGPTSSCPSPASARAAPPSGSSGSSTAPAAPATTGSTSSPPSPTRASRSRRSPSSTARSRPTSGSPRPQPTPSCRWR